MKFSQVAILAAASFVAAQETTTEGGLISSITAAPSKTTHKPSLFCTFQALTTPQAPPSAVSPDLLLLPPLQNPLPLLPPPLQNPRPLLLRLLLRPLLPPPVCPAA